MKRYGHFRICGLTLLEVMVSAGVLAITTIAMTQSMLILNRNSAIARVRNLAKAFVLGRIQEVASESYSLDTDPQVIPQNLTGVQTPATTAGTKIYLYNNFAASSTAIKYDTVSLGDASTELGSVPAQLYWTITNTGKNDIIAVDCWVSYTFLGRIEKYEAYTYRAPD